ncbi:MULTISPECIES: M17 family metallopeptidase [unclassified Kaistella]|uniref:leucyl aminopeptidase family protein n=1 Tax=unclassified Kaistella TaxID=2762626 RepID=UPI002732E9D2|nr:MULTISPECIES: leucyl aminopeptidase family protein [unclassified Kaistella]MDP2454008.1 leucyl aminopeptidase family protein [Kaistella sp. SH11-4b]MDP2457065.1 leucyl aminopeptidase family protein [Kaistella sp. SH40-3]MDP2459822.1 leucyl aminopeptidase family protein [Kaistella sp. SH19-2b]
MKINLTNTSSIETTQKFTFFTEENWQTEKANFSQNFDGLFSAKKDETFILLENGTVHFLIGLGANPKNFSIQSSAEKFSYDCRKKIKSESTFINTENFNTDHIESLVKGLFLGTYEYPFKSEHPLFKPGFQLQINSFSEEDLKELQLKTFAICEGQFACMEWLNKPQNFKKVPHISGFLNEISEKYNLKQTVFDRKKSEELGLGAFLSVNQGSSQEAAFTILEYHSEHPNAKTVGLVGKCVLFDTGGISIKGSENLHYMKSDMGGATAIMGTLIAAATLQLTVNLVVILPITDNAVSNTSYIPSDVVTAYNGKTIEVLDTDAEGRMTLADGLSYLAKNYKTDALIDLATLTGSAVRMFGSTCAAYFSNNNDLKKSLEQSADETNQRLWNLPLWDIWKDDFKSDVADFKNISSKPFGDCIVAGKFLEQFIMEHPNWAHLDIAGVAFGNVRYMKEKGATGYGMQLLLDFLQKY